MSEKEKGLEFNAWNIVVTRSLEVFGIEGIGFFKDGLGLKNESGFSTLGNDSGRGSNPGIGGRKGFFRMGVGGRSGLGIGKCGSGFLTLGINGGMVFGIEGIGFLKNGFGLKNESGFSTVGNDGGRGFLNPGIGGRKGFFRMGVGEGRGFLTIGIGGGSGFLKIGTFGGSGFLKIGIFGGSVFLKLGRGFLKIGSCGCGCGRNALNFASSTLSRMPGVSKFPFSKFSPLFTASPA
ncbi:hypothetical protein O6P43_029670 [Quillaja saponaria]|uniref:Uncharacterized protein n=1 Tax=Quillaja saponaria TaxID=32244 RepID=A0AAD7L0N4_QUISA|nr:hypothetical protein O6P43_029670 [Quillaja saponaria]